MTIPTTIVASGPYTPNGVTTAFPFGFKALSDTDVAVVLIAADGTETVISPAAYSVSRAAGDTPGGTVNMLVAPVNDGRALWVVLDPSFLQEIKFEDEGAFNQTILNNVADEAGSRMVWLRDRVLRSLTLPAGETWPNLPNAATRANNVLGFDFAGDPVVIPNPQISGTFPVMTFTTGLDTTLFVRPSLNIANGTMLKAATPDFNTDRPLEIIASTVLIEPSSKIQINPTPNSFAQGLVINQSSPTGGAVAGPFYFNVINVTIRSKLNTGGIPGNHGSGTWAGLQVSVNAGGVNYDGDSVMGGSFGVVQTLADTSLGDKNGLSSGVVIDAFTLGKGYGGSSGATVGPDGSCPAMVGYETDVIIESENVDHVVGFNSWAGGSKVGIYTHAAYAIGAAGGMGQNGNGVAGWKTGFRLYTQGGQTNSPMATDGSLFDSDHDATLANIFNFSNVTVTGDILKLPRVTLTGGGILTLKAANAASSADFLLLQPRDYAAGKPALKFATGAANTTWIMSLWDGASSAGTIKINTDLVDIGGQLTAIISLNHGGDGFGARTLDTGAANSGGAGYRMLVVPN